MGWGGMKLKTKERDCDHGQLRRSCPICAAEVDYSSLLARHNELVDAVAWSRECDDCGQWAFEEFWVHDDELTKICYAARAEVDWLIAAESTK